MTDYPDLDFREMKSIPVPENPWDEIVPGLFMGGTLRGGDEDLERFVVVVTLHDQGPTPASREMTFSWQDISDLPPAEELTSAVTVASLSLLGFDVLVRCEAGLNRSGLVVAQTLLCAGWDPEDAIQKIRERRSPWALCNPAFVQYVRNSFI